MQNVGLPVIKKLEDGEFQVFVPLSQEIIAGMLSKFISSENEEQPYSEFNGWRVWDYFPGADSVSLDIWKGNNGVVEFAGMGFIDAFKAWGFVTSVYPSDEFGFTGNVDEIGLDEILVISRTVRALLH